MCCFKRVTNVFVWYCLQDDTVYIAELTAIICLYLRTAETSNFTQQIETDFTNYVICTKLDCKYTRWIRIYFRK